MGRRFVAGGSAAAAMTLAMVHCASLSGLDAYSSCDTCEAGPDVTEPSNDVSPVGPEDAAAADAQPGEDVDVSDADDGGDDTFEIEGEEDAGPPDDGGAVADASHDAGSPAKDAGGSGDGGVHDAAVDAADAAMCNAASCPQGCCTDEGLCAGGGLTATCGMGGAACHDCASSSLVCSGGACVTAVADSGSTGPPACMPSTCSNLCVPYFLQCCKSDQSCGCALLFPPGPCN